MDKVLAFSILGASPADVSAGAGAGGHWTRLSWRGGADDQGQAQAQARRPQEQRDREEKPAGSPPRAHGRSGKASLPRFAPEFDGIDCFETIVSH
ncbi:hypothetical protein C2845_PM09G01650 [Panicum miliaceum]|uniref:Uncharacterized protein n=1 Tax=Panicum miliaceum TaxID=4540 RepID=A0A3L6RYC0_PANMI|nr:hypothetical protein C2845_PM09G01650 [Panicum miliaceum]